MDYGISLTNGYATGKTTFMVVSDNKINPIDKFAFGKISKPDFACCKKREFVV